MPPIQILRSMVNERLAAAAEEIFRLFESTLIEYEGEINRQRTLMDVLTPDMRIDPLQLSVCEEEVPPGEQERSPSLDQEEPELPHIKEEQEELWANQEGPVLRFSSSPASMKRGRGVEKPHCSWHNLTPSEETVEEEVLPRTSTEHLESEPDGEDYGEPAPDSNLYPAGGSEPTGDDQQLYSDCSGTETEHSDDWKEENQQQSSSKIRKSKKKQMAKGEDLCKSGKSKRSLKLSRESKSSSKIQFTLCCKVCGQTCPNKCSLMRHVKVHSKDCGLCGKHLESSENLKYHLQAHRTCHFCGKVCAYPTSLERHIRIHRGVKVFGCSVCGKRFGRKGSLMRHMIIHTGEKRFSCAVCGRRFGQKEHVQKHMATHTDYTADHFSPAM